MRSDWNTLSLPDIEDGLDGPAAAVAAMREAIDRDRPAWLLDDAGDRGAAIIPASDAQLVIERQAELARGALSIACTRDRWLVFLGWVTAHVRADEADAIVSVREAIAHAVNASQAAGS